MPSWPPVHLPIGIRVPSVDAWKSQHRTAVKHRMNRKTPETRKIIIRECLNRLFSMWTAVHGAWTRDKMMAEMELELKARRRAGSYEGSPTPLSVSTGRHRARKKGGV